MSFVIIQGLSRSEKTPVEFVEHIVYGNPRIEAVEVGQHFVAICEYPSSQDVQCASTFDRMGSFSGIGAQLINDRDIALREFGIWVKHYAPGTVAGNVEAELVTDEGRLTLEGAAKLLGETV